MQAYLYQDVQSAYAQCRCCCNSPPRRRQRSSRAPAAVARCTPYHLNNNNPVSDGELYAYRPLRHTQICESRVEVVNNIASAFSTDLTITRSIPRQTAQQENNQYNPHKLPSMPPPFKMVGCHSITPPRSRHRLSSEPISQAL